MDFLLFVSYTHRNDLFKNTIDYLITYDQFIHMHFLPVNNYSLLDTVLSLSFNKECKMNYLRWVQTRDRQIFCRLCNKFLTELIKKAIKQKLNVKALLDTFFRK